MLVGVGSVLVLKESCPLLSGSLEYKLYGNKYTEINYLYINYEL